MKHILRRLSVLFTTCLLTIGLVAACGGDGNSGNNGDGNNGSGSDGGGNNGTAGDAGSDDTGGGNTQGLSVSGETCEGEDFTACGGDLTGTWTLTGGCVTPTALPYYPDCSASVAVSVAPAGQWVAADDGTYTVTNLLFETELDAVVPKTCLESDQSCADNSIDDDGVEAGDACELNYGHDEWIGSDGTYTTDGNALTMVESNHQFEYCVDGDTLTLKRLNTEHHETIITLKKQ
jgi:hypothetical protein